MAEQEWERIVRRIREQDEDAAERRSTQALAAIELGEALIAYHASNLTTTDWEEFNKTSARYHAALAAYKQVRDVA